MTTIATYSRRYAVPLWGFYLLGLIALAATNWMTLEIPELASDLVNSLANSTFDKKSATSSALFIILLGALVMVVRAVSRILIFWPGRKIETQSKTDLFDRMLSLPVTFFNDHGMGDLISRLSNDIGQIRVFYAFGLLQVFNLVLLVAFTIYKMLEAHVGLTLACLSPIALSFVVTKFAMPRMFRYSKENQEAIGRLTNRVTEAFSNVHIIQTNAAAPVFTSRVEQEVDDVYKTNIRLIFIRTAVFPLMTCLAGVSQLVVLFYGGYEIMAGRLSVGDILAFNVYIGLLTFPLTAMGIIVAVYQRAKTAIERIAVVDDAQIEDQPADSYEFMPDPQRPILEMNNVSFRFPSTLEPDQDESKKPFELQNINLQLKSGERLGVFGPIGSGKTTLLDLIARLFEASSGEIRFGGTDIRQIPPKKLREHIGYALQTPHLFSDSVRANLELGGQSSGEEYIDYAKLAAVDDDIQSMSKDYDTLIGENGIRLSGGQKQRLALARTLLKKPTLLILDDVLSAVDHSTEKKLIENIYKTGSALIMTSHRGTALKDCHSIIILENGKIAAQGTWEELRRRYPDLELGTDQE